MGIRAKLFLWIGFLILFVTILMFLLPTFFIKKDILETVGRIQSLIRHEHQELEENHEAWLKEKIHQLQGAVNAILFLINEANEFKDALSFKSGDEEAWKTASHLLAFNPDVGLVQLHNPQKNKTLVLISQGTPLYSAKSFLINDKISLIQLSNAGQKQFYVGYLLDRVSESEFSYFALFDLNAARSEIRELSELLEKERSETLEQVAPFPKDSKKYLVDEEKWAETVAMIEVLAPLFGGGLMLNESSQVHIPVGIAQIDSQGRGEAILSEDAFRTQSVFNDIEYYKKHAPSTNVPAIAQGEAVLIDPKTHEAFIGNTIKLGPTYITLGGSLSSSVKAMALASNREVIFSVRGDWNGFTSKGERLTREQLNTLSSTEGLDKKRGSLTLGNNTYFYSHLTPLPEQIDFYILTPQAHESSILGTLLHLDKSLTGKILYQLLYVMIASLILALLILERLSLSITRPITQLAKATENISGGNYDAIALPKMGKRKDEIATLTNAFEEMVKGLKEREKIRGVLNKVVSKDVADEILKSSIHLGGEDRVVTMLFSDIRGFTKLTETLPPQDTIQMLNEYMTKMFRVIEGEGGIIDKYVGDEIMAIYGAPISYPDHAIRALSAAKLMMEILKKWNEERNLRKEPPIEMGIGIHTGLVVAGNMGAEDRLNYTVIGANVNLAARLCQAAKPMQILISDLTLQQPNVKDWFYVKPLESISLKGFTEPVMIYEIVGFKWLEDI